MLCSLGDVEPASIALSARGRAMVRALANPIAARVRTRSPARGSPISHSSARRRASLRSLCGA